MSDTPVPVLAFLGDAVLSLQVRSYLAGQNMTKVKDLQAASIGFVSAKAQAAFADLLIECGYLSEAEEAVFRRGRNHHSKNQAKNSSVIAYRKATGLEVLWGWLYQQEDHKRLEELWTLWISRETNLRQIWDK
ncbi:MAG: ribonuclease III [Erysipelotrichaceae bacterium]|nr:ribonuclease III [Erysipelotrichaceae bacterium]